MEISKPVATVAISMATTTITHAAAVSIIASMPAAASRMQAYNGSPNPITLLAGPTGVKPIPYTIPPGLSVDVPFVEQVGAKDELMAQAIGADSTTGFLVLNFFG